MICTFVLTSGSVKGLAEAYGVSYPTMRTRLNGLIERLRALVEDRPQDPVGDYLAELIARGRIAPADAARIRELHRSTFDSHPSSNSEEHP